MFCTSQNYYHCECSTYLCVAIEQLNEGHGFTQKRIICVISTVCMCVITLIVKTIATTVS